MKTQVEEEADEEAEEEAKEVAKAEAETIPHIYAQKQREREQTVFN